jgi:retinol dehydrogenase-12
VFGQQRHRSILSTSKRCSSPLSITHWLFTQILLPALFAATDASSSHENARIVTVSSSANYLTLSLDFDAIADGPLRARYGEWQLYFKSKFVRRTEILPTLFLLTRSRGNVVVAQELARRYGDKIVSMSFHPGNIHTVFCGTFLGVFTPWLCVSSFLFVTVS